MIIISLTTIPARKSIFPIALNSILRQTYRFDKLCINIDDNLSVDDYSYYDDLKKLDNRIEINKCEAKWRSCNKLLPTIKKYPNDIVITVEDDISYDPNVVAELLSLYTEYGCICCEETNPALYTNGKLHYENITDIKLFQKSFSKYLSNACLFPPHVFDGSDVFDYDKMMEITNGNHDELWFWINSTIVNKTYVVCNDNTMCMAVDHNILKDNDKNALTNINAKQSVIDEYNRKINVMYGDEIKELVKNQVIFFVNRFNLLSITGNIKRIMNLYGAYPNLYFKYGKNLKRSHISIFENCMKKL